MARYEWYFNAVYLSKLNHKFELGGAERWIKTKRHVWFGAGLAIWVMDSWRES